MKEGSAHGSNESISGLLPEENRDNITFNLQKPTPSLLEGLMEPPNHAVQDDRSKYSSAKQTLLEKMERAKGINYSEYFTMEKVETFMKLHIPILEWLPKYTWRLNLRGDFIAGMTISVMAIPQSLVNQFDVKCSLSEL